MTLTFVILLSPFLRLLPGSVTYQAGSAVWVSASLSIIPVAILSAILTSLLKKSPKYTGLSEAILRTMGKFPGSVILSVWSLWLIFHAGFILRSGADRFIATIYPSSKPLFFIGITIVICLIAACGEVKAIARSSEIFRPLLLFVILLVLVFSLCDVEPTFLLRITEEHIIAILKGLPLAAEPAGVALINAAFLLKFTGPESKKYRLLPWLIGVTILSVIFCAISVGSLGKTYTSTLAYPFFIMARDLSILSGVERIEALVVGLWLLPDFVIITVELMIAADNFLLITGKQNQRKQRRIWVLIGAALATLVAFRIAPDSESMMKWSYQIIPAVQLGWAYLMIPFLLLVAALRKKF